jgi:hypothetical protein
VEDKDLNKPYNKNVDIHDKLLNEFMVSMSCKESEYQGKLRNGQERIRHRILLKTSFENRENLFNAWRHLLKPELTEHFPSKDEEPKPIVFKEQLRQILIEAAKGHH